MNEQAIKCLAEIAEKITQTDLSASYFRYAYFTASQDALEVQAAGNIYRAIKLAGAWHEGYQDKAITREATAKLTSSDLVLVYRSFFIEPATLTGVRLVDELEKRVWLQLQDSNGKRQANDALREICANMNELTLTLKSNTSYARGSDIEIRGLKIEYWITGI
jgi:hypothetical protein